MGDALVNTEPGSFLRFVANGHFLTGLVVGGLATLVLTQPGVQRALFRSAAKAASLVSAGVAEAKERFHDAEAEIEQEAESATGGSTPASGAPPGQSAANPQAG